MPTDLLRRVDAAAEERRTNVGDLMAGTLVHRRKGCAMIRKQISVFVPLEE